MRKNYKIPSARRDQLDRTLLKLGTKLPPVPRTGWIREIREALLMSSKQLAKRLQVTPSVVSTFERSEQSRTITLGSLDRIADALNCEVRYVLIPKKSLSKILFERARRVLDREESAIEGSMRLEGQGASAKFSRKLDSTIDAALMLINKDKRLWED